MIKVMSTYWPTNLMKPKIFMLIRSIRITKMPIIIINLQMYRRNADKSMRPRKME